MRVTCEECPKTFVREPWRQGQPQRFCSPTCRNRANARAHRKRQKQRLAAAETALRQPAATDVQVSDATAEAFTVLDELRDLQQRLRVPQRMEEAHSQVEAAQEVLEDATARLKAALETLARADLATGEGHP